MDRIDKYAQALLEIGGRMGQERLFEGPPLREREVDKRHNAKLAVQPRAETHFMFSMSGPSSSLLMPK